MIDVSRVRRGRIAARTKVLVALGALTGCIFGSSPAARAASPSYRSADGMHLLQESVTRHTGTFDGTPLQYTAVAKATVLRSPGNTPIASIFSVTYEKTPTTPERPVMFLFNGGPGASAAYLEIGALGPQRVVFPDNLKAQPEPPYPLIPNESSPLDVTDLVFIDPPDTGYSHSLPGDRTRAYASISGDASIIAQFIRTWLAQNGRMSSPKYLLGESYGATRAALVADILSRGSKGQPAIAFNGVILLGQMLTVDDLGQRPMNAQGFAVRLPTMVAIAQHYGRVQGPEESLPVLLSRARAFAFDEYLPALMRGRDLPPVTRLRLARRLSAFTGLPAELFIDKDLEVTTTEFRRALIPGRILGNYDARYSARVPSQQAVAGSEVSEDLAADPSWTHTNPVVSGEIATYLRDQLGVRSSEEYVADNPALENSWDFGSKFRAPASTWLADAISRAPRVFVLVASGYDDLATPFTSARYLVSQLPLEPGHGWFRVYEGGHQFYTDAHSLRKFSADLRSFVRVSSNPN